MKQHRGPRTCVDPMHLRARGTVFFVLSYAPTCGSHAPAWDFHAPTWATKISPNLIHFKAHQRGFHREYLGFEDNLQAIARDRGDDASHHSILFFSFIFFVFPFVFLLECFRLVSRVLM